MVQIQGDGCLDWDGSSGTGWKWLYLGCILKSIFKSSLWIGCGKEEKIRNKDDSGFWSE